MPLRQVQTEENDVIYIGSLGMFETSSSCLMPSLAALGIHSASRVRIRAIATMCYVRRQSRDLVKSSFLLRPQEPLLGEVKVRDHISFCM